MPDEETPNRLMMLNLARKVVEAKGQEPGFPLSRE